MARLTAPAAPLNDTSLTGEPLVKVTLVPVEVFGTECSNCDEDFHYGLCDAVGAGSDCNRAVGRIYRRHDTDIEFGDPDDVITVYVPESELWKFDKRFGEEFDE